MDVSYSAEDEQFRAGFRDWLAEHLPQEWRRPGFWGSLDSDEAFQMRRAW